jgi:RNA polymerase sigma factor (sigma-70 family)
MTAMHSFIITMILSLSVLVDLNDAWTSFHQRAPRDCGMHSIRYPRLHPTRGLFAANKQPKEEDDSFHFLDDGKGHIRGDLATSIYNWDHGHQPKNLPHSQLFSTRDGLRMVDSIAKNLLQNVKNARTETTYSDLVQEGIVALLQAMATYHDDETMSPTEFFPDYAKRRILQSMTKALAHEVRPVSLPPTILTLLEQAKVKRQELMDETGREPTMAQVASELNVSPQQLELYTMLGSSSLSVERTMEIYNNLQDREFADSDTWQARHNAETDNDDEEQEEGEDEMWIHLETVAAPLEEMIVDTDTFDNPDRFILETMFHDDVQELLQETLTQEEFRVIKLKYGLDEQRSMSIQEIGNTLGIKDSQVAEIEKGAMEKLRSSFQSTNRQRKNVETLLDETDGRMTPPSE